MRGEGMRLQAGDELSVNPETFTPQVLTELRAHLWPKGIALNVCEYVPVGYICGACKESGMERMMVEAWIEDWLRSQ